MIIRIEASGGSFLGAGKYYLHDKLNGGRADAARSGEGAVVLGQSDERVWFTDTRNTLNSDPQRALEEMWRTAEDQAWLKMQAGVKRGGRVCEDPVKTISLSWHKDDTPTPEHMVASADAFLKHMGWDNHQAVYVAHRDTEHRHIHIILNRVDHETGRTLDDYRERKRAQSWALAYEKEHDNVRCEEREVRAAIREQRAPELNGSKENAPEPTRDQQAAQPVRTPANDHLPHNVIMLARPQEQAFKAEEKVREQRDSEERAHLKAEQRAEREAFFKDGAKLFKATRHAVYDEVRQEYAPEWRQLYKDSEEAQKSAEAWSANAVSRAFYFARSGRWDEARAAFSDRDSVRDAVAAELAERKADLKGRQTGDLRERQREACDALREVRDVQYQGLLQRQRDERAVARARQTLEGVGLGPDAAPVEVVARTLESGSANENRDARSPEPTTVKAPRQEPTHEITRSTIIDRQQPAIEIAAEKLPEPVARTADIAPRVAEPVLGPLPEAPEPTRQVADLAAGSIGAVASYLADQLGEMFAPTPPEVREANAKAEAKREAEKPAPEPQPSPYAKIIDAAVRAIEAERASKNDAYWKERDRGKDWERDR